MEGMDDSDHNTQSRLPAVVVPRPVISARRAEQRPTRWHPGRLPDRLVRASRHPAVAGSLATAAGLMLRVGLRRIFTPHGGTGSAITPTPPAVNEGVVLFRRTVMVETWTMRARRM
jgi:hypothetical protein